MAYKARTLDQILSELNPAFTPQIKNLQKRQSLIPQTVKADISEAEAKQSQAYEDIVGGARRRGLGFSGIPLGEQAKYASTVFAPEVLRARSRGQEAALSLEDAILGVRERQRTQAQNVYQTERDRQFQAEQARLAREAQARAARAAAASSYSPSLGVSSGGGGATPKVSDSNRESAFLEVQQRVGGSSDRDLISDYNATLDSANRGNARDKIKIEVYRQARPDLFRSQPRQTGNFNTGLVRSGSVSSGGGLFGRTSIPNYIGTF